MFARIYTYRLRILTRNYQLLWWTLLFPLLLSTIMYIALGNIDQAIEFRAIPVAIVDDAAWQGDANFRQVIESVSEKTDGSLTAGEPDSKLLAPRIVSRAEADQLLLDNQVAGILLAGTPPKLEVRRSDMDQSILKIFLDQYTQTSAAIAQIARRDPAALPAAVAGLASQRQYLRDTPISKVQPDTIVSFFYAVIAMVCLYGGFWGLREVNEIQADQSPAGARLNASPRSKMSVFIASTLASLTVHITIVLLLMAYQRFVLGISFGTNSGLVLLAAFCGSVLGVIIGAAIGALLRTSFNVKIGLLVASSMLSTMLAGLMFAQLKYLVTRAFPAISLINPAHLITDAFYALYYYDGLDRYWLSIAMMAAISLLLATLVYFRTRRQDYASL